MFELTETISRNNKTNPEDTAAIKFALTSLGFYDDTETGLSPYADDNFFHSVQAFQEDKKLKVDGIINPDGPTQKEIKNSLKKDKKAGNAYHDFMKNYLDMRSANTVGADKYFHCKANYEATIHGAEEKAKSLSKKRIEYKKRFKNDSNKDLFEDETANIYGREAAKIGKFKSAEEACAKFRPKGLDDKY